jgi:hypothetical protein
MCVISHACCLSWYDVFSDYELTLELSTLKHAKTADHFSADCLVVLLLLSGSLLPVANNDKIDQYYLQQFQALKQKLQALQQSCKKKSPIQVLQQFNEVRQAAGNKESKPPYTNILL